MSREIYVNLAVKDLGKSMAFFEAMGFSFHPQFTDDTAACMIITEHIFAMLLTEPKFKSFCPKELCDTGKSCEVMVCLSCRSREEVDRLTDKALAEGGTAFREPVDVGFMYGRSFQDLDGHIWELMFMDPTAMAQESAAESEENLP